MMRMKNVCCSYGRGIIISLAKGGYVLVVLVCLLMSSITQSYKHIAMKFYEEVRSGAIKNWLNYGSDLGLLR